MGKLREIYMRKVRPHARKTVLGLAIFFAVFTLVGFFALPPVLKYVLTRQLDRALHRTVAIDRVAINPYALSVTVRGLKVRERASEAVFFSCERIYLNFQTISAFRLAPVFKEVTLTGLYLGITRNKDLSYNFSDLMTPSSDSKPLKFALNNISIEKGSIDFNDEPTQKRHKVRDLALGIPFVSNIPSYVEIFVQPHFSARIDDARYRLQGRTKPFADAREASIDVDIRDLDIPYYLAYMPVKTKFGVSSGRLDIGTKISFMERKGKGPLLTVSGKVALKKLAVEDDSRKPLLRLPLLDVSIARSEPLSGIVHLSGVLLQSPELVISRDEKGVLNILSLMPTGGGTEPAGGKAERPATPLSLDIDGIRMTDAKISFSDSSGAGPFTTTLYPVDLKVDRFSNLKDRTADYVLSLETEARERVNIKGRFSLEPLGSEGLVEVASVLLKKYSPYYKDSLLFAVEDGNLDLSTRYTYSGGEKEPSIGLSALSIKLDRLRLRKTGEKKDFLSVPVLTIGDTDVDLTKRTLKVGNISTREGELNLAMSRAGELNVLGLVPPPAASKEPDRKPGTRREQAGPAPWLVTLRQLLIDRYTVRMEDQTTRNPVTVTARNLRVSGENISTAKNSKAKVVAALLLNGKGNIAALGTIGMDPLFADLKLAVKGVEFVPFQPYFSDKVRMRVTGGSLSTNGTFSLSSPPGAPLKAAYRGEASLNGFSAVNRAGGEDLLKFESLALSDLGVTLTPFALGIKGVSLTNFYALVSVDSEGKINLKEMMTPEGSATPTPPAAGPGPTPVPQGDKGPAKDIRIDRITLQGGRLDFADRSVKPGFSARISEMGGRVSGLSAAENSTGDVELRAKLDDYAPLEITGRINPLRNDLFVDLKARIKDLDLSPATPYSGKYVGYTIEKGKFSADVSYLIDKGKLNSQNSIFIDQFSFGEKVESPGATNLPVKLAVALLKDRRGEIKLELPVTGNLNDPQFSVWGIILKIIVNLVTKAATSPFALLGAAFGGGEELSFVEFDYGITALPEPAVKKLETLSKALIDRPSLKLDIEGHVDRERDLEGLKRLLFERKIKAQKLKGLARAGEAVPPVDEVKIEQTEHEKYLKMAYKQEKFPKPKNVIGLAKDIPASEMEKLMLTNIEVNDGDLRALATQRAMRVKDAILRSGKVEPERVFIVEPKSLEPEKKEKTKGSRVDFRLK